MGFFFAWVGGPPIPPVTLATTGDVWGGSIVISGNSWNGELKTTGDIMTTGIWRDKGPKIKNLRVKDGLIIGHTYAIDGPGLIPSIKAVPGVSPSVPVTTFLFTDEEDGGILNPPAEIAENVSVTISTVVDQFGFAAGSNIVHLDDISALVVGVEYGIGGRGISPNTLFVFDGSNDITISNPATATGSNTEFTISLDTGRNIISNLGSADGLEVGEVYQVFGKGVTEGVLGIYQSDGTLLLSQLASETFFGNFLRVHRGTVYPDGGPFIESEHARHDEIVLSVSISQNEGEFASLLIDLKNPRTGLLAPGRNVWCWLSWQETDSSPIIPLFHGRLEAIPTNIIGEKVSLHFIAQPGDFDNQRNLLGETLKELPYFDPIWFDNGIATPDTILESRPVFWHTDRVTLAVSVSNYIIGEDETIEVEASEHIYASMNIKFGSTPLTGLYVTGSVSWSQEATGSIDITPNVVRAFKDAGSEYNFPFISAYCGDGLVSSWPKPGQSIGAGWSVGFDSIIIKSNIFTPVGIESRFVSDDSTIGAFTAGGGVGFSFSGFAAHFPLDVFAIQLNLDYQAKRDWTENVSFFLEADVQEIVTDSRAHSETLALSSSIISSAIDDGGLTPLRDLRLNTYFKTERGQQSFQFLLAYARAKLMLRARAVTIEIVVKWAKALGISCRQNVHLTDYRIPGGEATGKVVAYELIGSAAEGMRAKISLGCTIGRGGVVAASEGTGAYASPGYMASGYQAVLGGTVDLGDGSVAYQSFGDFVINDDGVSLFDLSPATVIKKLKVIGGPRDQVAAISTTKQALDIPATFVGNNFLGFPGTSSAVLPSVPPAPADALKNAYPLVELELIPLTGGGFISDLAVDVSMLQIPKTIDLEAPSNA